MVWVVSVVGAAVVLIVKLILDYRKNPQVRASKKKLEKINELGKKEFYFHELETLLDNLENKRPDDSLRGWRKNLPKYLSCKAFVHH